MSKLEKAFWIVTLLIGAVIIGGMGEPSNISVLAWKALWIWFIVGGIVAIIRYK